MTLITIREQPNSTRGTNATVSFDHQGEYELTVARPFSDREEQRLAWYFEEHLRFPFVKQVLAQQAAASITAYGEALFNQVFADRAAYARYAAARQQGVERLYFEIAGTPEFHAIHWEALKDPDLARAFAVETPIVRKHLQPQTLPAQPRESPTVNVLIVTARPDGAQDVGYRTVARPLVETLRQSQVPVQIDMLRPGTYEALSKHLDTTRDLHGAGYYHVVHFDLHGALLTYAQFQQGAERDRFFYKTPYGRPPVTEYAGQRAFLFMEGPQDGQADPVEANALAALLQTHQVPIAILNACQSGMQIGAAETSLGSRLMQAGAQLVLAMAYSVTVSAATLLMQTLYEQLFAGRDLATAIRRGRRELHDRKARRAYFNQAIDLEDWLLPVVYQNQELALRPRAFTPEEQAAYYTHKARHYNPTATPAYGFFGRDIDILQIERDLLLRRNLLLVRGMGGAGKTTLLHHLGAWWQQTGLVEQVLYFGYDERAWTRQQLLDAIGRALYGEADYLRMVQPLGLDVQQSLIADRLRGRRHLLILDNLESITGAELAIQHTLPEPERRAQRGFLAELAGGQTLVLLGSRSGEAWLAPGTFEENVHELGGLDPEAASALADAVLKRHGATAHRAAPEVEQIVQLLAGYPLALEVVLANLKQQTPAAVLAALQGGDIKIDPLAGAQDKTRSILQCIAYSHSNLAPDAQRLLLCLAPFVGVINAQWLPQYTQQLRQQPALADLPFDQWQDVLQAAVNWGLLALHPAIEGYLTIQPTLPYFLRNRLADPALGQIKAAIDAAFLAQYRDVGNALDQAISSKDARQRKTGLALTGLEFENLRHGLDLALEAQTSLIAIWFALDAFLQSVQGQLQLVELGRRVLDRMAAYAPQALQGRLSVERIQITGQTANYLLLLKQLTEAREQYLGVLDMLTARQELDSRQRRLWQASAYHQLGMVAEEQRQWKEAEQYYQQAVQILIEFNARYEQASTYHQLGMVAQAQRQWKEAEQYYQQAVQIYVEFNARYEQASTYHQLGRVAQAQRQWKEAEQYYQQAVQIYVEFNDRYEQAGTYHQLGMVAEEQRQWKEAEQYYQQAVQISIEFNDRYEQASTYHQLGRVAEEQRQWKEAEQYYQQAVQIYVEFNARYEQASTYHQLGRVAEEQRQWKEAEQYYQQAVQIYVEFNDRYEQASTYHQLGMVAEAQRQWKEAREHLLTALRIFHEFNDEHSRDITLGSLARLQRASVDTTLAEAIAQALGTPVADVDEWLRKTNEEQPPAEE